METFAGLGYTAGPLIGGFLYEFGGFQVPFLVLGAILILATVLGWWLIENFKDGTLFLLTIFANLPYILTVATP